MEQSFRVKLIDMHTRKDIGEILVPMRVNIDDCITYAPDKDDPSRDIRCIVRRIRYCVGKDARSCLFNLTAMVEVIR